MKLRAISFSPFPLCYAEPRDGLEIDRRLPGDEALAEGPHPLVILVELLTAGQRPPGDQLVDVGVAGVVADLLALDARPGGRGDDLARLRLDVAEADLLVFLGKGQVGVFAAGYLAERFPCLDRHLAIGLREPASAPPRWRRCRCRSSAGPWRRHRDARR